MEVALKLVFRNVSKGVWTLPGGGLRWPAGRAELGLLAGPAGRAPVEVVPGRLGILQ